MYRINLVIMVVLSVAVIATGAFLAIEKKNTNPEEENLQKLIRQLTDNDPDVRREAETQLKGLGYTVAAEPLREAAKSKDPRLAERAQKILSEIEGRTASKTPEKAPEKKEEPAPEIEKENSPVEVALVMKDSEVRGGAIPRFYVRITNRGALPVVIARDRLNSIVSYARFSRLEILDNDGRIIPVVSDPGLPAGNPSVEAVVLGPGETLDLYAGQGDGMAAFATRPARGQYRVRFVYDASEGSPYRTAIGQTRGSGSPLPPEKFISNEVGLVVLD